MISRDVEKSFDWTGEGDDVLDERTFYLQNWRHDIVAIVDSDGLPIEEVRYTAYGTPTMHPIADVNHDGIVNATDATVWVQIQGGASSTGVWSNDDLNRDELFPGDMDDDTFFYSRQSFASGSGYGFRAMSGIGSRKGYAGYEWDNCCTTWHVRHRVLDSESGKWTRMDPLGYVDSSNVYCYAISQPMIHLDPSGLDICNTMPESSGQEILVCGTEDQTRSMCVLLKPGQCCSQLMNKDYCDFVFHPFDPGGGWKKCPDGCSCSITPAFVCTGCFWGRPCRDWAPGDGIIRTWPGIHPTILEGLCKKHCASITSAPFSDCTAFNRCMNECMQSTGTGRSYQCPHKNPTPGIDLYRLIIS